ncbi:MAG: hypothetical protein Q9172_002917 [Xanthocarpia lactea]
MTPSSRPRTLQRPFTPSQLRKEREEFFETRVTGRAEIWGSLKLCCESLREGDVATAQGILDAVGVTVPTGDLVQGAYDEQGGLYALPGWVVGEPEAVVDEEGEQRKESVVAEGAEDVKKEDKGKEVAADGRGGGGEGMMRVRARLSDRGGPDVVVLMGREDQVGILARRIVEQAKMAYKRSRATFEADLQAQQSPYVIYGTPLPPLDPDTRDDGSYVPVWKQEVTDEQGRKRLHGAFTGGFSAGYFNTVGSKEGWTPSTFVSSRATKKKDVQPVTQQKPEDFMDDEDIADAEEAKKLQTAESFAGFGTSAEDVRRTDVVMDIMKTTGETMGVKLLKRMGWKEGQGIGPKVRRKAKLDEKDDLGGNGDGAQQIHLFAPEDSKSISLVRKTDRKGLGFEGEGRLDHSGPNASSASAEKDGDDDDTAIGALGLNRKSKNKKSQARSGFGVGVLNDDGSGDEDPYSMGPKISYNRVVGGDKKIKPNIGRPSANPLLNNKPVFISKKTTSLNSTSRYRRCHDGRLPLDGFILSSDINQSPSASQNLTYRPPMIPEGWKSTKSPPNGLSNSTTSNSYRSTTDIAKASTLSPKSRAALLGETALAGKSVFDFLTPNARSRLVTATKNEQLPPALSEAPNHSSVPEPLSSLVPQLSPETARTALGRGTAGWMPYAEDLAKRGRYRAFLEVRAGLRSDGTLPERAPGFSTDEWVKEMQEFAHAAQIFKPMTGMMATRFASSSSAPRLASDTPDKVTSDAPTTNQEQLLRKPREKPTDPAEEAAKVGMYGPITREMKEFYPTRLLCKRFNVRPPAHVQVDPGQVPPNSSGESYGSGSKKMHSEAMPQRSLELVGKRDMNELMKERRDGRATGYQGMDDAGQRHDRIEAEEKVVVDLERNEALEKERPGEEVFKAIFGSDSEDE